MWDAALTSAGQCSTSDVGGHPFPQEDRLYVGIEEKDCFVSLLQYYFKLTVVYAQ
jgi:hypothetical protein